MTIPFDGSLRVAPLLEKTCRRLVSADQSATVIKRWVAPELIVEMLEIGLVDSVIFDGG